MLYFKNRLARETNNSKCFLCGSELVIKRGYKITHIIKCSNDLCESNLNSLYKIKKEAFFECHLIKKHTNSHKPWEQSPQNKIYWINKGYPEEEAINKAFQESSKNQKSRSSDTYSNSWDIKYLLKKGYSEEEAKEKLELRKREGSRFCVEFWLKRGFSEDEAKNKIFEIQSQNGKKVSKETHKNKNHPQKLSYWEKVYPDDSERAYVEWKLFCKDKYTVNYDTHPNFDKILKKRKETWMRKTPEERKTINKSRGKTYKELVEKHGEKRATRIIDERCKAFKTRNWSKISKRLFEKLEKKIGKDCFYAENEKLFVIDNKIYYADFWDGDKFIIEFFGDTFHANPAYFSENDKPNPFNNLTTKEIWGADKERIETFTNKGYNVFIVWEKDFRENENLAVTQLYKLYEENNRND